MALETATYISDLVSTNPTTSDNVSQGDDHIKLLKAVLKTSFPGISGAVTASHSELNVLDGITASTSELNILDGVTATAAELNVLDGITATTAELNTLDGITASAADLNLLTDAPITSTELSYLVGTTSNIQTQLDAIALAVSTGSGGSSSATSVYLNNNGLKVKDTDGTHALIISPGSNLTADRTLNVVTGDADRTLTLNSSVTLDSGSYTPTLYNTANVSSSTAYVFQWLRVGNVVTVSGRVEIDPTNANTITTLGISLPIASNFTNDYQCSGVSAGVSTSGGSVPGIVYGDSANDRAVVNIIPNDNASRGQRLHFTYQVL